MTTGDDAGKRPRGGTSASDRGVEAADRAARLWAATWRFRRSRSSATPAWASLARTNAIRSASRCSLASFNCATAADRHLGDWGREPVVDEGYDPTKPLELVQKPAAEPAAAS